MDSNQLQQLATEPALSLTERAALAREVAADGYDSDYGSRRQAFYAGWDAAIVYAETHRAA